MFPELEEIKRKRKELGISVEYLSNELKISADTIRAIENKKTCKSYENIKKIFDFLEAVKTGERRSVSEIANRDIVWVYPSMRVNEALKILFEKGFSQLPLKDKSGRVLGIVNEETLLDIKNGEEPVGDFLSKDFIIVDHQMPARIAKDLLKHLSVILVSDKGTIVGIVTRSDYLKNV